MRITIIRPFSYKSQSHVVPSFFAGLKDKDPETIHYVAPHGTSAIVKHFLAKSKVEWPDFAKISPNLLREN